MFRSSNWIALAAVASLFTASVSAHADCQPLYYKKLADDRRLIPLESAPGIAGDVGVIYAAGALGLTSLAAYSAITVFPLLVVGGVVAGEAIHEKHLKDLIRLFDEADWISGRAARPEPRDKAAAKELARHDAAFSAFYVELAGQVPGLTREELATVVAAANRSDDFCHGEKPMSRRAVLKELRARFR